MKGRPSFLVAGWLLMSSLALVATASCANDDDTEATSVAVGDLEITGAFARAMMDDGAVYFTVENTGDEDDALVEASSDVAEDVGLHETVTEGAMAMMQAVEEIAIPASGEAVLEPGGYHVMLTELKEPLEVGDTFKMTLIFKEAGSVDVGVEVTPFTASDAGTDDPYNPSYRVVTAQVLSIESAMGMRGGLGALLRGGEPSWHAAAMRVMAIERAWTDIRSELEHRAEDQAGAESAMDSFESSLANLKAGVAAEEASGASRSLTELSGSFEEVKGVLHTADVDGGRLATVVIGFVVAWIVLSVACRLIANWRDARFMRPRRKAR